MHIYEIAALIKQERHTMDVCGNNPMGWAHKLNTKEKVSSGQIFLSLSLYSEQIHCDQLLHVPGAVGFPTLTDCVPSDCELNRPFFS